jgi:light-regulated signal transduction histidine kinase (bacteriophytochrome)
LTYSRITTQGRPFVPVDLSRIAREVLSDLEVPLEETEAEVHVGDLATIEADPMQMRQLFQNLLGNALKFHRPGVPPEVWITGEAVGDRSAAGGGHYRLVFRDNGVGFEDKYAERIFAVFQRLHARHEYAGSGIGLAICRKIAARHGGDVTARSVPEEGSVFTVTLPMKQ